MKIGSSFPSKYVKADDLPEGEDVRVVIDHVELANVAAQGQAEEKKPILFFRNRNKGMVLNKTNAKIIEKAYGDETDDWAGKPILLYSTDVEFKGDLVLSIRVRIPKAGAAAAPAANGAAAKAPAPRQQTVPAEAEEAPFVGEEEAPAADEMDNPPW